jgi:hypothetical protein
MYAKRWHQAGDTIMPRTTKGTLIRQNLRLVKQLYPGLSRLTLCALRNITESFGLSVSRGEISCIADKLYITHAGLIRIALRRQCRGIRTHLQERQSDAHSGRWVFKATVYKGRESRAFVGYGDADPSNTSPLVRGSEMRVAETRAVNRALRKAYGIGLCSVEELGSFPRPSHSLADPLPSNGDHGSNGSNNRQPRLRDQLCLLIRQYDLDPTLVKAYAADFCGTATLKEASRDLVESFISELSTAAKSDRDSLLCKLNSYAQSTEVKA